MSSSELEIICPNCEARFGDLSPRMLPTRPVLVRCPECGSRFTAAFDGTQVEIRVVNSQTMPAEPPDFRKPCQVETLDAAANRRRQADTAGHIGKPVVFRDRLTTDDHGPAMVIVPCGRYRRGSSPEEEGHDGCEMPPHEISIARPFAIGRYPVTFDDWALFQRDRGRWVPSDHGWGRGLRPVIDVSWKDATAYADWLSDLTGHGYRLPSEAEWEYACRAGTLTAFFTGDTISSSQARFGWTPSSKLTDTEGSGRPGTVPVGQYPANTWRIQDMHGNVWEWTADCWNEHYIGSPRDGSPWLEGDCRRAVLRGGAWNSFVFDLRSASRASAPKIVKTNLIGFRVVREFGDDEWSQQTSAGKDHLQSTPESPPAAGAPAVITQTRKEILTPVDIHGWSTEAVQERQRRQAEALGMSVIFRDQLADGSQGPEMVLIPSGYYLMGSPEDEPERYGDEGPQHVVAIPRPFAIGRYALTFAEWDRYADSTGAHRPDDEGWGRESRPVINVSGTAAKKYLRWLSDQTGENYRLPSEAEWEYACRAGTTTRFNTGDIISTEQSNFNGERPADGCPNGHRLNQTVPVGSYSPNPFNLHEMHGNVQEWVVDYLNESHVDAPNDDTEQELANLLSMMVRGGSWFNGGEGVRSAYRNDGVIIDRCSMVGFRVARSVTL